MREVVIGERYMGVLGVLAQGDVTVNDIREHDPDITAYPDTLIKELRLMLGPGSIINTTRVPQIAVYRLGKIDPDIEVVISQKNTPSRRVSERLTPIGRT